MRTNEMMKSPGAGSFPILHTSNLPILGYHRVCDTTPSRHLMQFIVSPTDFELQMSFLSQAGYQCLSLKDYVEVNLRRTFPRGKYFVLTFDDGYRDNYLMAMPILRKFGFKATIFIVSSWLLQGHDGREEPSEILHLEEADEMTRYGITFGAHTMSHRSLIGLPPEDAYAEIRGSKEALEHHLNRPIRFFSYPYGHSNPLIRSIVRTSGFEGACSNHSISGDLFALPRQMVKRGDSLLDFRLKLQGWNGRLRRIIKQVERHLPT